MVGGPLVDVAHTFHIDSDVSTYMAICTVEQISTEKKSTDLQAEYEK